MHCRKMQEDRRKVPSTIDHSSSLRGAGVSSQGIIIQVNDVYKRLVCSFCRTALKLDSALRSSPLALRGTKKPIYGGKT